MEMSLLKNISKKKLNCLTYQIMTVLTMIQLKSQIQSKAPIYYIKKNVFLHHNLSMEQAFF